MEVYEHANWVLVGIGVFLTIMLYVGWRSSSKIHSCEDYLVAGRGLGLFVLTGTMFATWFGAGTAMGGAGYAYLFGIQGVMFDPWGAAFCLIIVALLLAKLLRRGRFFSSIDMIQLRYGKPMALIAVVTLALADLSWLAGILLGGGAILAKFTGLELSTAVTVATVIVVVYTLLGGMWAVAMTDVWQMIILLIGLALLVICMLIEIPDGISGLFTNDTANTNQVNKWDFFPTSEAGAVVFEQGTDEAYSNEGFLYYTGTNAWVYFAAAIATVGLGSIPSQSLLQRFFSAKSEKVGVNAGILSGLMYMTIGMVPVLVGMLYFMVDPSLDIDDASNNILMYAAIEFMPPVLTIVFIVALTAAIMSSADSIILAVGSLVGNNVLKLVKPNASDKTMLLVTRVSIPIIAALALIVAIRFESIYKLVVASGIVALVGITMPFLFGFFWKRANQYGAVASFVIGVAFWIGGYFFYRPLTDANNTGVVTEGVVYQEWALWDAIYMGGVWGVVAAAIALVVVSLLTQRIDVPKPLVDVDGQPLDTRNFFGIPGPESKPSSSTRTLDNV